MIPEQALWSEVIIIAINDALKGHGWNKEEAIAWFYGNGKDFRFVCDLANIDPDALRVSIIYTIENKKPRRIVKQKCRRIKIKKTMKNQLPP